MNTERKQPRGIRNNNPLNIRRGKTPWEHEITMQSQPDEVFCQFGEMRYGWRAAFLLLRKYIKKYGLNTIEAIIRRWAPDNENHTEVYIDFVAQDSVIGRRDMVRFEDYEAMYRIAAAMCAYENGAGYHPLNEGGRASRFEMTYGYGLACQASGMNVNPYQYIEQ